MNLNKILILVSAFIFIESCSKSGGVAPSSVLAIAISPTSLIVPKSISTNINVFADDSSGGTINVTTSAQCSTASPYVVISSSGQISNNYTGSSVQSATVTCVYEGLSVSIPMTIVPATLQSLRVTKNNMQMDYNQNQPIQVYGNFVDSLSAYVFALDMTNYVTWSSDNSVISTANAGTVYSMASNGSAVLTAQFLSQSVSTDVTVSSGSPTSATPLGVGLTGTYYDFTTGPWTSESIGDPFERLFGSRIDSQVYFDWSTGTNNLGQPLYFGIRWTGRIYVPTTGSYTFYTRTDDGVRLWIDDVNGSPVIDNWTLHAAFEDTSAPIVLTGGQFYNIKMEYFENAGYSVAELRWSGPGIAKQLIPQLNLFPF